MVRIDQELFESYVPAFTNATDELWLMVRPLVERALSSLSVYGDAVALDKLKEKVACLMGARDVIPHVDMVATPQGFAVVRNEHLVPASKERVDALKESIRRMLSDGMDALQMTALRYGWGERAEAKALVNNLVWCATIAREIGLHAPNDALHVSGQRSLLHDRASGLMVYDTEFLNIHPRLMRAHYDLCRVISPEQMDVLLGCELSPGGYTPALWVLRNTCMDYICAHFSGYETVVQERRLLNVLRGDVSSYGAWAESAVRRSQEMGGYENRDGDAVFFFG